MLLNALECAHDGCRQRLYGETDRWHLIETARDNGWTVSRDEMAYCPEHGPQPDVTGHWVVGCWTCDFEEEFDSEEEAKNEWRDHECEPDTWIHDPEKVRDLEARRAARREVQTATVTAALSDAAAQQDRIESYANQWLRIRNFFLFWKKAYIHERDE